MNSSDDDSKSQSHEGNLLTAIMGMDDLAVTKPALEMDRTIEQRGSGGDVVSGKYQAPKVGVQKAGEEHLISANSLGYFDTEKMKFTKEATLLSKEMLQDALRIVAWMGADEIFLQDDETMKMKLHSRTFSINHRQLSNDEINSAISELKSPTIPAKVRAGETVPFAFSLPWCNRDGKDAYMRFRGNGTRTMGSRGASEGVTYALRRLGDKVPTPKEINLDDDLLKLYLPKSGIVITSGETGSGKTTLNSAVQGHIVSNPRGGVHCAYEQPVEFDLRAVKHPNYVVGQTDLNDALDGSFAEACKDAMRRNSDTILIGETRDVGSARGVINLALSGHAVYTTFHAGSPMETLTRILSYFPFQEHLSVMSALIGALQLICCVKLIPTIDGGRIQVRGYLPFTSKVKAELNNCTPEDFIRTVRRMYETYGHTMQADLKKYRDRVDPDEYIAYMAIFDGGEHHES